MDFDLVEQLKVSLFENSIDVAIDFAEIGLDIGFVNRRAE